MSLFYWIASSVPGSTVKELQEKLNKDNVTFDVPAFLVVGKIEPEHDYHIYTVESDIPDVERAMRNTVPETNWITPKEVPVAVTSLWINFVQTEWPNCSTHWHIEDDEEELIGSGWTEKHERNVRGVVGMSVTVALVAIVLALLKLRSQRVTIELEDVEESGGLMLQELDSKSE
mmetsp:Transcript_16600/g.38126  ORF Transcript_16600/g.38126 Transcript_16600/m.38126 type:complete len:174 (+) Transcript_16600:7-528(+)